MNRSILPKTVELKLDSVSVISDKSKIILVTNSDDEANKSNAFFTNHQMINFSFDRPFSAYRLNQWHTNEEIFNILSKCSYLLNCEDLNRKQITWMTDEVVQKPKNGSIFLFDRRKVKNFKKDGFSWKRRKTGGANSVREDRMYLKINGIDCIYGCYSHSSIIPTFHRRCYWLLDKPDFVLVHYLQTPNSDTGECFINLNLNNLVNNSDFTETNINTEELKIEIKSMLWPYYLTQNFLNENLKIFSQNYENLKFSSNYTKAENFIEEFLAQLFENDRINLSSIRVNLMGQNLNDILHQINLDEAQEIMIKKEENSSQKIVQKKNIPNSSEDHKSIQLSINNCLSNSEEKLFLIGNWANPRDDKFNSYDFRILLCEKEIKLNKLNQNVLECKLPNFSFVFDESNKYDIEKNVYKTSILVYQNDNLYCEPLPFEIRRADSHEINEESFSKSIYRNQFLILEKLILLSKIFNFDIGKSYFSTENSQEKTAQSQNFESKICKIIDNIVNHGSNVNFNCVNDLTLKNDGKTLLHMCAENGLSSACESLKKNVLIKEFLSDEVNHYRKDQNGSTPSMSACQNKHDDLTLYLVNWHFEDSLKYKNKTDLISSDWYFNYLEIIEQCKKISNFSLLEKLNLYLTECKIKLENEVKYSNCENQNFQLDLEIEKIKNQIIPYSEQSITSHDLNSLPSPVNAVIDENFSLVENLGDLSSFLSDDSTFYPCKKMETEKEPPAIDVDITKLIDFNSNFNENLTNKKLSPSPPTCGKDDDQDEKIKALADNIIAAMPYKIKSHRYSSSNLMQQKGQFYDLDNSNPDFRLHRNSSSFDEGYDGNYFNTDPRISIGRCYSSSTRSSLSPTASISYQYGNDFNLIKNINNEQSLDDSPGDDSMCSSSFHIDCTPSTAEFCQYFHASSSSGYYKNAIEKGFSQLTLTDDEQRELYEAALIIQNAYRRYIMRKKKKIKLDLENSLNSNQMNEIVQENTNIDDMTQIYPSSSSVSSFTSDSLQNSSIYTQTNFSNQDDDNSSGGEEHRQYEAACIIQKYYRRYKQYENLHKYTEAAVKIQTRYRAYKSTSLGASKFRANPSSVNNFKSHYNHGSIDETTVSDFSKVLNDDPQQIYANDILISNLNNQLSNQKQVARKLINIRQSSRFSPASTPVIQSNKPTSNLSRKFSNSSLNNQFNLTDQNFNFNERENTEVKFAETHSTKSFTIETPVNQSFFTSNNLHDFSRSQDTFNFSRFQTEAKETDQNTLLFSESYLVERQQQLQQLQQQQSLNKIDTSDNQDKIGEGNKSNKEPSAENKKVSRKRSKRGQKQDENSTKPKKPRAQRAINQPTESSIASSSSSSSQLTTRSSSSNISQYLSDLYNTNNKDKLDQIFSFNSLFNSSQSLLTKLDLKVLFQPAIFESLPRQAQLKLIKLLPECDRQFDSHGSFKLSIGALNNEFIKKCCVEWQQKLANGNFENLESNLQNTTITRSTRLKQQKLLESLQANENGTSDEENDEFFYYDEDEFLDPQTNQTNIQNDQNDKSIYESAESSTSSLNSSFNEEAEEEEGDDEELEEVNQTSESSSDQSFNEYLSPSSDQESIDEAIELKRKELEQKAKRLIRKKEKLSSKFSQINTDCMISTTDTEPVRKSLRKRTLSKKFTDDEYSLNEEDLEEDKCKLEVSLEDQKGELKLKIKRVQNQANLNKLNSLETDDFPSKRKRNNSNNFKSSLNNSPLSLFPELSMSICSPAVSPSAVSPTKIIIKQNSSPPVHLQAPPPPVALPIPPQNIFNDDDDDEILKKEPKESPLPDSVKTLALLKNQIAEKKRKLSEENLGKRSKSLEYNSNIQKLVSELKSIGSNSNDNLSTSETFSPENRVLVDDFINVQPVNENQAKLEAKELPSFLVNLDLIDLLKEQQQKEKKQQFTQKNLSLIDTTFLSENLDTETQNLEITLPNINTLILKINTPVGKTVKETTVYTNSQFVSPMPVQQYPQTPSRVLQSPVYQNGYQTPSRPNFVTSSPNYQNKQSPQNFQYQRYPSQIQSPQFMTQHVQSQMQQQIPQQIPQQVQMQQQVQSQMQQQLSQQVQPQIQQQVQPQMQQQVQQQMQQQVQPQLQQQIQSQMQQIQVQAQVQTPIVQQMPQQFNQFQNYNQYNQQQQQQQQVYNTQNVVLVQSPLKYQNQQQSAQVQHVYNGGQNMPQQQQQQIMKPVNLQNVQMTSPQMSQMNSLNMPPQTPQTILQQQQQSINVSIPQQVPTNQNLVNTIISPINSQNSQSSPGLQPVTPTKAKRKEKEKLPALNVNTNTTGTTPSQISSNSVNNQNQVQNQQSRSARSTQHQLTVAQLLSQKHQQQQQQQQQKVQEINRTLTSPLTIPTVIQVNEQNNQGSQIVIPASLTSSSQTNNSQLIKIVPENAENKNVVNNAQVQNMQGQVFVRNSPSSNVPQIQKYIPVQNVQTPVQNLVQQNVGANSSLSIPTSLSQSAKLILNETNNPQQSQTVTCIPLSNLNFNHNVGSVMMDSAGLNESDSKKDVDESSQTQLLNEKHDCTNKKAMIECDKCFLFCHDDCIYYKNVENRPEPIKLCANCLNETEKMDTN